MSGPKNVVMQQTVPVVTPHGADGVVPTVRIKSDEPGHAKSGGFVEINASSFDPTRHELMPGETNPLTGEVDGKPPVKLTAAEKKTLAQQAKAAASAVQLLGSTQEPFNKPVVVIKGNPVDTAAVIASAHAKSKLTAENWNKLADGDRFVLLENEVKTREAWG